MSDRDQKKDKEFNLVRLLTILFLPFVALSIGQNGFLGLLPFVREAFSLSRVQIGYYSTSFFVSAMLLAIFTGSIVDRLGPKKSMLLGIGSMGVLLVLHGLTPNYGILLTIAFLAGIGFSIITPSVTKGVMQATSREKRGMAMGITQTGFGIGGIAGASLLPLLGEIFGWRIAIQVAGIFVVLMVPLVYWFYQEHNHIKDFYAFPEKETKKPPSLWANLYSIFKHKTLFHLNLMAFIFGMSEGAVLSHFMVFLTGDLGMSKVTAGLDFSTLHLGGMIGLIGWG